jgi:hypothetical protein
MKYISAPTQWVIYQVPDETWTMYSPQMGMLPPAIVLEMMCYNGKAKRIGIVGGFTPGEDDNEEMEAQNDEEARESVEGESHDETEEPEGPPDGLWYNGKD